MNTRIKSVTLLLYGLAVIISGCIRYFGGPDGDKGLWFGLVMGAVALLGGGLLGRGNTRLGLGVGGLAIFFVGGWFVYEALIHKGIGVAEVRQLVIIAATVVAGVILAMPSRPSVS